jgi:hypothetical protein
MKLFDRSEAGGPLSFRGLVLWGLVAWSAFVASYSVSGASSLILVYLYALLQLTRARSGRTAFYAGLCVGFV